MMKLVCGIGVENTSLIIEKGTWKGFVPLKYKHRYAENDTNKK